MMFEIGKTYTVIKVDGIVLTFKFLGGNPLQIEFNGKIYELLQFISMPPWHRRSISRNIKYWIHTIYKKTKTYYKYEKKYL